MFETSWNSKLVMRQGTCSALASVPLSPLILISLIRYSVLGFLQRGGRPSVIDRVTVCILSLDNIFIADRARVWE